MRFIAGDRVQISPAYLWAGGAIGTVTLYPEFPPAPNRERVDATTISVCVRHEAVEETWITFDQPQFDLDGDGPYPQAGIPCSALTRLN